MQSPNSARAADHDGRRPVPVDEFDAIARLREQFEAVARLRAPGGEVPPLGETWIGDDAAVVGAPTGGRLVLATDLVVEGVHVDLARSSAEDMGYKALMVTVSDLAAMGVRPTHALASLAGPEGTDLRGLGAGLAVAAGETGCVVVGGDLSRAPVVVVSIAVVGGSGPAGPPPLLRSGARPGDRLFTTGPLGRSAAGMRLLHAAPGTPRPATAPALIRAHRRPAARLDEGEAARRSGATAAIDVSDGLVADLIHLAEASGVGVDLDDVPVAEGATLAEALGGGEEYELVVATGTPDALLAAFSGAGLPAPLPLGRCTDRPGEHTLAGEPLPPGGWRHTF